MSNELVEFEAFMQQRREAANAYVNGDPAPVARLSTNLEPATFFGPNGGRSEGAKAVIANYERAAAAFETGGESHLEIRQIGVGNGLAFWAGVQHAMVRIRGEAEPVKMDLRVTEVFRFEDGAWKLVHRHADTLVSPPADKK